MPIHAVCPECDATYSIADDQQGKKVRCKGCQTIFVAGPARPRKEGSDHAPIAERPMRPAPKKSASSSRRRDEDDDFDVSRKRKPARRKQGVGALPWILAGGGAAILLVAGAVTAVVVINNRDSSPKEGAKKQFVEDDKPINPKIVGNQGQPFIPGGLQGGQPNPPFPQDNIPPDPPLPKDDPKKFPPPMVDPPKDEPKSPPGDNGDLADDALKRVEKATALIKVTMPDGGQASGSGFFGLENNLLVTNAHVLGMLAAESRPPAKIEVILNSGEANEQKLGGEILGVDRLTDLAILRTYALKPGKTVIPSPLTVKSANSLKRLQKLYVSGFPLGESIGKELSIRSTSISSLRQKNGSLYRIQVEGGMLPGNSGGPVVDSTGEVVGVAVSIIRGTQLNFAIPADHVMNFVSGRIHEMGVRQSYFNKERNVALPLTVVMVDPLNHIKEVAVDVWVGDSGSPRNGAKDKAPQPLPTDSKHEHFTLNYQGNEATGEAVLPPLTAGKEYWIQPNWLNASGQRVWASAAIHPMSSSPPVDRKAVLLALRPKKGEHKLDLKTVNTLLIHDQEGQEHAIKIIMDANMKESANPTPQGTVLVLTYDKFLTTVTIDGENPPNHVQQRFATFNQYMKQVQAQMTQDNRGNLQQGPPDVSRAPANFQSELRNMHEQIQHALEALAVPLPNAKVEYGKSWEESRTLPIDTVGSFESGAMAMKYTYLGTRRRNGKDEAVIGLDGVLKGPRGFETRLGGKANGTAIIDLATGLVTRAHTDVTVDLTTSFGGKVVGKLEVTLGRTDK